MNRSHAVLRLVVSFLSILSATAGWTQVPENTYQELHWRMIGPFRGGRTRAAAGVPSQPNVFYVGQVNGGVWKNGGLRPYLDPHLRSRVNAIDRCHCGCSFRSQHHLCQQRRGPASPRPLRRQRHLQVHRRRQDLDPPWPRGRTTDSCARRRPARSQPHFCRRTRSPLRPQRRAGNLPLHRRRENLAEGDFQRREHRRL